MLQGALRRAGHAHTAPCRLTKAPLRICMLQLINGLCFSTNCTSKGSKFSSELQL